MLAIGIDPGLGGGIAWTADGKTVEAVNMPDGRDAIWEKLNELTSRTFCCIERLSGGSPGGNKGKFQQKRSSMWKLGVNYGQLTMACEVLFQERCFSLSPREWQMSFGLIMPPGTPTTVKKNAHKAAAAKLYPGCKPTLKTCDAILLTYFAWKRAKIYRDKHYGPE